jgi:hypothetical protein
MPHKINPIDFENCEGKNYLKILIIRKSWIIKCDDLTF